MSRYSAILDVHTAKTELHPCTTQMLHLSSKSQRCTNESMYCMNILNLQCSSLKFLSTIMKAPPKVLGLSVLEAGSNRTDPNVVILLMDIPKT